MFSALTVAIALATLLLFPLNFLQSMAIGGAGVALVAAAASCLLAPAFFALWNVKLKARDRAERADARWYRRGAGGHAPPRRDRRRHRAGHGRCWRCPRFAPRGRPSTSRRCREGLSARTVGDELARDFPGQDSSPVQLAVEAGPGRRRHRCAPWPAGGARSRPSRRWATPRRLDGTTWQIEAIARGDAAGVPVREAVESIRGYDTELSVLVGGEAADFIDQQSAIGSALVPAMVMLAR